MDPPEGVRCRWALCRDALFSKHCFEWRSFGTHNTTVIYVCLCKYRQAAYICVMWCVQHLVSASRGGGVFLHILAITECFFSPKSHNCNHCWAVNCLIWQHPQFTLCLWHFVYLLYIIWDFCNRDSEQRGKMCNGKINGMYQRIRINNMGSDWPIIY